MASIPESGLSPRNNKKCINCGSFGQSVARPVAASSEMKSAEGIIAAELKGLSIQERVTALDDLHCVGQGQEEDPEVIRTALEKFEEEVRNANHPAYNLAVRKQNPYVQDSEYRLRFLRGALFDVKKAVRQMLSLLQYQAEYFGVDALDRRIALSDLKEEEVRVMLNGMFHYPTQTDRNGRYVTYCFSNVFLAGIPAETMIRSCLYANSYFTSFPDLQKKGLVGVYMDIGEPDQSIQLGPRFFSWVFNLMKFMLCLPLKFSSSHYCINVGNSKNVAIHKSVIETFIKVLPSYARARTKLHYGSALEIRYSLQSHGIPMDTYPIDSNGNIRQDMIDSSCLKHYGIDASNYRGVKTPPNLDSNDAPTAVIPSIAASSQQNRSGHIVPLEPKLTDVLLGRGKPNQNHPGNIQLRAMIEECQEEYDAIGRLEKRQMIQNIKHACHSIGTRFLKQQGNKNTWVVANSSEADEKIRQHFRCARKKR
ncbi:unnamed protein product [Cylindrotheca closterium]|uniref:DUF6824 domain-containing protein n=1 Tax=Cylindrotheca closterium TaxID=2856 RepID=A0AAD2JG93_9STRA|nr:unnamed protein product [Cylindrotheca closterium]